MQALLGALRAGASAGDILEDLVGTDPLVIEALIACRAEAPLLQEGTSTRQG